MTGSKPIKRPSGTLGLLFTRAAEPKATPYAVNKKTTPNNALGDLAVRTSGGAILYTTGSSYYLYDRKKNAAYELKTEGHSYSSDGKNILRASAHIMDEEVPGIKAALFVFAGGTATLNHGSRSEKLYILSDEEKKKVRARLKSGSVTFFGLPQIREISHSFKTQAGEHVIVTRDANADYKSSRVFAGPPGKMTEKKGMTVTLLDDGASLSFTDTAGNILYIPTPGRAEKFKRPADWNGQTLIHLGTKEGREALGPRAEKALGAVRAKLAPA